MDASLERFIYGIRCLVSQLGEVRFLYVKPSGNSAAHGVDSYLSRVKMFFVEIFCVLSFYLIFLLKCERFHYALIKFYPLTKKNLKMDRGIR